MVDGTGDVDQPFSGEHLSEMSVLRLNLRFNCLLKENYLSHSALDKVLKQILLLMSSLISEPSRQSIRGHAAAGRLIDLI
ncbi:AB hydrolase superfamily protein B1A11.02 [Fusarium oxysporum f. sp. albedinis]|nr:AB hydrolase superfamily protein B1A11.02 [Fusarium oxysporum f. sp. albedinis]